MKWLGPYLMGLVCAGAIYVAYSVGIHDGINQVIASCANYGKYHLNDAADEITCIGPFNSIALLPEYQPYSQELKDKHKKERK